MDVGNSKSISRSRSASSSKSFSSKRTPWWLEAGSLDGTGASCVRSMVSGEYWKESCLVRTEDRADFVGIDVKLGDFLLIGGLMFGVFARSGFAGFVYPVKAPIDCD